MNKIPLLEKFAAQSLVYVDTGLSDGKELIFSKEKFAELIVRECMAIARNREDELESANLLRESRAVGIVVYRMARQFGVEE